MRAVCVASNEIQFAGSGPAVAVGVLGDGDNPGRALARPAAKVHSRRLDGAARRVEGQVVERGHLDRALSPATVLHHL